ncbi:MAG TPA: PAS domain S-box protein, partial [Pyrinomonadaceae bacterium]|nr:PAS domain S-box protein [Pyrinomonadaceae bacterium]
MAPVRRSPVLSYGFALLVVALAVALTWLFPLLGARIPFALFYAAVMLASWYGGKGPGLVATALSALFSAFFIIPPHNSLNIGLEGSLLIGVFLFVSLVIVLLTDKARQAEARERRSRDQLFIMLRSIGDAVIATDAGGRVSFMNQIAQDLTGWTLKEAEGRELREVFQIINEETRQEVESPVAKVIREGMIVGIANHTLLVARDGREIPIDDSGAPIRDEAGRVTGVVLVFRDIAERRRAEDAHQRLASIVESSEDAIIGKTLEGVITSWNAGAARLYGYSAEEVIGQHISILVPPDRPEEIPTILGKLRRNERVEQLETSRVSKDGRLLDVSLSISPMKSSDGTVIGAATIARDITERKRVQQALLESEERLMEALEAARMGTWEWNIRTGKLNWSETLPLLHGLEPGETIGTFEEFSRLVHPEDREPLQQAITRAIEQGTDYNLEFRVVWPDGSVHWIEGKGRAFHDETGKPVRMTGLGLDITDRKRGEEVLRSTEQRYRAFVRNSSEAIWRFELEEPVSIDLSVAEQIEHCYRYGYLAECNDAMAAMYGFRHAEEIVGARLGDLLVHEDERNVDYLRAFIQSGYRLTEAESHETDRDGNPKYFLNNLVGIIEGRKLLRAWGTQRDITERQLAEKERTALLTREQEARQAAERAAHRMARLQAITAALSEALTPTQAASAVLTHGLSAVGAHAGSIALLVNHGSELELLDAVGFPSEMVEPWRRFSVTREAPLAEAVRTGQMVLIESLQARESLYPRLSALHAVNGSQALAAVPLILEGRTIGAMGLTFKEIQGFGEDDRAFMLAIARQCAQAIERGRLYQA